MHSESVITSEELTMDRRSSLWFSSGWFWGVAVATCLLAPAATTVQAQPRRGPVILPTDGSKFLINSYTREIRQRFDILLKGTEQASKDSKEDMTAIDISSQWYAFRLTWEEYQGRTGGINQVMEEFDRTLESLVKFKSANQLFTVLFFKQMALRLKDVLLNEKYIASVNGARMLARLVDVGSEEAADVLLAALKDPQQNDGVKYWALVGLRKQLAEYAQASPPAEGTPVSREHKDREIRFVEALVGVIQRKPVLDHRSAAPEEIEGQHVCRREAVRALAQVRTPLLRDEKNAVKARPAQVLLQVLVNDGMKPDVYLDEQLEAAVGVAQMQSRSEKSYQPDYAAFHVGHLVTECGRRAPKDPERFPWRYQSARLGDALEAMRENAKGLDDKVTTYVATMVDKALKVLRSIESGGQGDASDLKDWLSNNAPPSATLFKGMADATVKPTERSETAAPEKKNP
jgi:hypothetical protein